MLTVVLSSACYCQGLCVMSFSTASSKYITFITRLSLSLFFGGTILYVSLSSIMPRSVCYVFLHWFIKIHYFYNSILLLTLLSAIFSYVSVLPSCPGSVSKSFYDTFSTHYTSTSTSVTQFNHYWLLFSWPQRMCVYLLILCSSSSGSGGGIGGGGGGG